MLEEYGHRMNLFLPKRAVRAAGILLLLEGAELIWSNAHLVAVFTLTDFLVVASFMIHRFWDEANPKESLLEVVPFTNYMAILTALIYTSSA